MMVVTHGNCPFRQERKKDDARPWPGHCNSPKDCGVSMKGVRPGFNGVGNYVIVPAYTHIGLPTREDPKKNNRDRVNTPLYGLLLPSIYLSHQYAKSPPIACWLPPYLSITLRPPFKSCP